MDNELENGKAKASPALADRLAKYFDKAVIDQNTEVQTRPNLHAVAVNATEMKESNAQIGEYLRAKLEALEAEHAEIQSAVDIATENKWASDALVNVGKRLERQVTYYGKLLLAVDAGFTIVPNMPCDQFAIRTSRARPLRQERIESHFYKMTPRVPDEKAQILQPGEGRYESPVQRVLEQVTLEKMPDQDRITVRAWADDWTPIEFPFAAARPVVMTATQAAMALKLFDRIGLVPQSVRNDADPIVLGQIVLRESGWERMTSFLIAWHLDLRTL
jgi:hypothetical protein